MGNEAYFRSLPPGFRFVPRDDELVVSYLKKKLLNQPLPPNQILETNVYNYNPEELHEMPPNYGEKFRYYFTSRNRMCPKGQRPGRAAGRGFWKASNKNDVLAGNEQVGTKRLLVFHEGTPKRAIKTNWLMQEYELASTHRQSAKEDLLDMVLCKIYYKDTEDDTDTKNRKRKYGDEEPKNFHEEKDTNNDMDDQKAEIWLKQEDVWVPLAAKDVNEKKIDGLFASEKSDEKAIIVTEEVETGIDLDSALIYDHNNQKEEIWVKNENLFVPVVAPENVNEPLSAQSPSKNGEQLVSMPGNDVNKSGNLIGYRPTQAENGDDQYSFDDLFTEEEILFLSSIEGSFFD